MFLDIKDFSWSETESRISISVPTKGTDPSKVDILLTNNYVKVNCRPFLFEKFLKHEIHEKSSRVVKAAGVVQFFLEKVEPGLWLELETSGLDKETKMKWRTSAVEQCSKLTQEMEKLKEETRREQSQFTVKEMMKIDDEERRKLENVRDAERNRVTDEMEQWRLAKEKEETQRKNLLQQARAETRNVLREIENGKMEEREPASKLTEPSDIFHVDNEPKEATRKCSVDKIRAPIRESKKITISFTERVFPTPERESVKPKEEEWLKQQRERRQAKLKNVTDAAADTEDMSKQNDPIWLRDKGNSFFQAGDFESAIAAFSHAIEGGSQLHSLYSNRAACYLKTRNFFKAIDDASKALELLNPPVPQNLDARVRAHVRRGMAYCQLEMYHEGLMDYEKALRLNPDNAALQKDVDKLRDHCRTL